VLEISFIGSTMCISFVRDGKMHLGATQWSLRELDNGLKQIKDLLKGHPTLCLKMIQ